MTQEEICLAVRDVLREQFSIEPDGNLRDEDSFLGSGAIDSAGIIRLIGHLERQFGIAVLDDEIIADNFDSVRQASEFVFKKLV